LVHDVNFDDLAATFAVESVKDDSVHLPEICNVPLIDLYPTIEQENQALQIDLTADCLDRYRFFFTYIYMPWDNEGNDFVANHLLNRIKLYFDLKNKRISKGLSAHIRGMIAEAKYIQNKRENLENSIDESSEKIDISHGEPKEKARKLLELHLRMNKIKHEIDILVNPDMRAIYEEVKFPNHQTDKTQERKVFAVTKAGSISEQFQMLEELKSKVSDDVKIYWLQSLHDSIAGSTASSEIYIPAGFHPMNFLEYLNGNFLLCGLTSIDISTLNMDQLNNYAKVFAADSDSIMFAIDGDLRLQHLVIDCSNVQTGFLVKDGQLTIKNCVIYGSKESSVTEAFNISGSAKVVIENCIIMNFATAFTVDDSAAVELRNSVVKNSNVGFHLLNDEAALSMENSSITDCDEYGILKHTEQADGDHKKEMNCSDTNEMAK
jgi:hypothetical protein